MAWILIWSLEVAAVMFIAPSCPLHLKETLLRPTLQLAEPGPNTSSCTGAIYLTFTHKHVGARPAGVCVCVVGLSVTANVEPSL